MAFNSTAGRAEYTASAGQTVFPFLFTIFSETDIKVYQTPSGSTPDDTADLLTLTTDYTVTINGTAGGEITLVTGASINDTIVLKRNLPINRDVDYQTSGDLLADTLDADQDYQTYLVLDSKTTLDRALVLPETDVDISPTLPTSVANYGLYVNAAGTGFEYRPGDENGATLQAWIAQAHQKTSDSYATEAEDVFVKTYTSDGDGTFTPTDTTEYSALHWAAKAATFNPALYATLTGATFTGQVKGITPVSAEDLTRKDYVDLRALAADFTDGIVLPTLTNVSNMGATAIRDMIYLKVGNTVTCSGMVEVAPLVADTLTSFYLSLPVSTTFGDQYDCAGTVSGILGGTTRISGSVNAETVGAKNRGLVQFTSPVTSQIHVYYSFQYRVI